MPYRSRRLGTRVLKAVSSSIRLQVLNLLLDRGPLSYTEIMNILKLNPSRDAGRFAYHLKFLLKADLIEPDTETKKYRLTDLGRMLVDVAEAIDEHAFKRRKMMVRTSRLAMEEFDRNKIAEALVKEANVPQDLAQKIARETEGRLLEIKAKYLTAPLIREFVNAILIEKGLEEYRHKLTRLGLPVYDVTQLIRSAGAKSLNVEAVHEAAGDRVVEEYTLLNILPRDIADAHLSGSLHLNNLGTWILKLNEFMHDMRFFFQNGLRLARPELAAASSGPPKSLEAALQTVSNMLKIAATEVSGEQLLDYFNVFLAPFVRGIETDRVKENLRLFCLNLNQFLSNASSPLQASVGLELVVPKFLGEKDAIGPSGSRVGSYKDLAVESRLIASLLLEVMLEESQQKPVLQPSLIVKIRPEALQDKECEPLLYKAHRLAAERGLPYFANLCPEEQTYASYTATGCRLNNDWRQDWELDTLRTGSIGSVLVNLPRVAYESEGNTAKFYGLLDEQLEMALRALEIKYLTLKQRARENMLPFLTHRVNGDQYARIENSTRLVSFVGLNESVESRVGKALHEESKAFGLAEETMKYIHNSVHKSMRKPETRPVSAMIPGFEAARRLAELDVEHYGLAQVHVRGSKEQPFYTDLVGVPLQADLSQDERLKIEERLQLQAPGGHLALIQLADGEQNPDELLSATKRLVTTSKIGFFVYSKNFAYCHQCRKTFSGQQSKCPACGSVGTLVNFGRVSSKYKVMLSPM
jgi:anaerobic ribonucleoside-triphosphate reductase